MAGRIHPMTLPKRLALIGGWIITAVIFIASMIQSSISYDWYIRDYREEQRIRNDSLEHQRQLSYLEHEGWKVVRHKECGNNYVKSGEYYTGNRDVQYIDAWNFNRKMEYEVERTVHVTPGIYRLEAAARTDGQGCEIFACHDNRERKADVPVYGNQGGEIWQDAQRQQTSGNITLGMWKDITEANKGRGYGWSIVRIDSIVTHDGTIRYGVTNIRSGKWNGTWCVVLCHGFQTGKDRRPAQAKQTAHSAQIHPPFIEKVP